MGRKDEGQEVVMQGIQGPNGANGAEGARRTVRTAAAATPAGVRWDMVRAARRPELAQLR